MSDCEHTGEYTLDTTTLFKGKGPTVLTCMECGDIISREQHAKRIERQWKNLEGTMGPKGPTPGGRFDHYGDPVDGGYWHCAADQT
jgi:hypothetical protein|tara:strand:+ start:7923 stop:8180 length:258 start_codon:yes stop_codon:yes gene_type:complete